MNKYSMNEIFVTNPTVLSWFEECSQLDKSQNLISCRDTDKDLAEYACAEFLLRYYLRTNLAYTKLRSLDFFFDSSGGKFFNDHMLDYLGNPRWYTSGYDPEGFIGWHEDTCEPGYFIMFSYSKYGQGVFKYFDRDRDVVVELPDQPGWMVRSGFTGTNFDNAWWHSMSSKCPRWSWIYMWETQEQQQKAISKLIS
jgi:hypothetical protein